MHDARPQATHYVDDETSKTVSFMRRNGLLKFKKGDLEIELSPQALKKPRIKPEPLTPAELEQQARADKRARDYQAYLDDPDAVLFWSSGGYTLEDDNG
jgi:hypothetical protein